MFPDRAVHLSLCAPGLRSEFEHIALVAFARDGIHQLPRIRRIWFGDVAVESCLLHRGRAAETERHYGAQQESDNPSECRSLTTDHKTSALSLQFRNRRAAGKNQVGPPGK